MIGAALALIAAAGLVTGLALDLFALLLLIGPVYFFVLAACAHHGMWFALATATEAAGCLQLGAATGLIAREFPGISARAAKRRDV